MSSQSSYFTPQGCTALPWVSPGKGSAGLLSWALPSWGLLWDCPDCFVLTMHVHLQRRRFHRWPTPFTIPYNPSLPPLLVSSHSASPGTTRAPFFCSEDIPVNASSWAQLGHRHTCWRAFVLLVCPQPHEQRSGARRAGTGAGQHRWARRFFLQTAAKALDIVK